MSKIIKVSLGLSLTLLVSFVAIFFFLRHQVIKSFPEYNGSIKISSIKEVVEISRDSYGVPSIYAKNEADLWFAVGYVHAQDRLWQMDIYRRTVQGRLSEVFGEDALGYDYLFRTLDMTSVVNDIQKQLPDNVKYALSCYTQGVNAYIKESKGRYPVEFDLLNYEPELWQPEHSLLVSRLMAWYLNFSWWPEILHWKIQEKLGNQKAQEIFQDYPSDAPTIVYSSIPKVIKSVSYFIKRINSFREYFGFNGMGIGSNCWVINGKKSVSGKPILANDPHLTLTIPSYWYEMNLLTEDFNVGGFCFPGSPFVVIGHNSKIAWGLTNAMIDDADFFMNVIDPHDTTKYVNNKKPLPIKFKEEIIKVGKNDSVIVTTKKTHYGPVINYVHPSINYHSGVFDSLLVSLKWVGFLPTMETYTFYLLNKASSRVDVINALKYYGVPGLNFIYADVEGNIGYHLVAKIPVRKNFHPALPVPAFNSDYDWSGFVPFEDLPEVWNPPENFIASANNKIINKPKYYITYFYMPPYRIERIVQLLSVEKKLSVSDFQQFQVDVLSLHSEKYNKIILDVFNEESISDPIVNSVIEYLRNWDFKNTAYDASTSIFNMFFLKLLHNVFHDELGDELFYEYIYFPAIPVNAIDKLIENESSWFDDINTDTIETRNMIIRKSLLDAIADLKMKYGSEIKNWQWGNLHQLTLNHPLGKVQPLNYVFNLGPYKIGGSSSTINNSEIDFTKPFESLVGPSMRYIVDLSDINKRYCVIAGGQSGHPLHKHYDDQLAIWVNHKYREIDIKPKVNKNFKVEKFTIIPERR